MKEFRILANFLNLGIKEAAISYLVYKEDAPYITWTDDDGKKVSWIRIKKELIQPKNEFVDGTFVHYFTTELIEVPYD